MSYSLLNDISLGYGSLNLNGPKIHLKAHRNIKCYKTICFGFYYNET